MTQDIRPEEAQKDEGFTKAKTIQRMIDAVETDKSIVSMYKSDLKGYDEDEEEDELTSEEKDEQNRLSRLLRSSEYV
jgi:hypothetical protein